MKNLWKNLEENVMLVFILVMTALTLIGWVMKFIAKDSVAGINLLAQYAYAWVTMLAFGYSAKTHLFMKLDVITAHYPEKVKKTLDFVMDLVCFACCVALLVLGIQAFGKVLASGELNDKIAVPVAIVYAAPVAGFGLAVIRYLQLAFQAISGKQSR